MRLFISISIAGFIVFACNRKTSTVASSASTTTAAAIPPCIQKKMDSIMQGPVWNPPAEIHKYDYNGKIIYVMSAPCCDFFNVAVDADCNYVCAPSGGFTGKGDGKCTDFFATAKHLGLVWKDQRVKK